VPSPANGCTDPRRVLRRGRDHLAGIRRDPAGGNKIGAMACVLPEADVRPEDHAHADGGELRVQTIEGEHFLGVAS